MHACSGLAARATSIATCYIVIRRGVPVCLPKGESPKHLPVYLMRETPRENSPNKASTSILSVQSCTREARKSTNALDVHPHGCSSNRHSGSDSDWNGSTHQDKYRTLCLQASQPSKSNSTLMPSISNGKFGNTFHSAK